MLATARRAVLGHSRRGFASPSALQRLLSSLAILEQREGKLNLGSLSTITAAKKLGGAVHAFVAGSNAKSVAEEAAKVEGVEKIVVVQNAAYEKVGMAIGSRSWGHIMTNRPLTHRDSPRISLHY